MAANKSRGISAVDVHVGGRLAEAIIEAGLTLDAVASVMGVNVREVMDWCDGAARLGPAALFELTELLGKKIQWFYEGRQPDSRQGDPRSQTLH